jgi:hypothetical protein
MSTDHSEDYRSGYRDGYGQGRDDEAAGAPVRPEPPPAGKQQGRQQHTPRDRQVRQPRRDR